MKYKVKYYEDGSISVIEDYESGYDISIGKNQKILKEDSIKLEPDEAKYIKKDKDYEKMDKRIKEIKAKK